MSEDPLMRQVALVSYGNQFLLGRRALDEWYRHAVFAHTRFQFRDMDGSELLADDFTLWLTMLKKRGASRLSLHPASAFKLNAPHAQDGGDLVIAVHYPGRYQLWLGTQERVRWHQERDAWSMEEAQWPVYPDAARHADDIDTFWCTGDIAGAVEVPFTNWDALVVALRNELQISVSGPAQGPFFADVAAEGWLRLPLFPHSAATSEAHRLMHALTAHKHDFNNALQPANENSAYKNMSQQQADEYLAWGARLDSWITEVQLRCANHLPDIAQPKAPFARMQPAPPAPPSAVRTEAQTEGMDSGGAMTQGPASPLAAPASSSGSDTWLRRAAFALALAGGCLFVVAVANIIAAFPWLSLLLGLPIALKIRHKND